jgi:PIN domain nuclease of toxin-antitoxin system
MKLLLDTHILLWAALGRLNGKALQLVGDETNMLFFSSISIWEIVIKSDLNQADFDIDVKIFLNMLLEAGYDELPFMGRHALAVGALPSIHRDPFDRALIAQSIAENIPLVSADKTISKYPAHVISVPGA